MKLEEAVTDNLRGTRDALTVRRVFGDPYEVDGVLIIPVARVVGGGGGGGGEGTDDRGGETGSGTGSGSGFGTGFGLQAHPVGVYTWRDGELSWHPSMDVNRLAQRGQMLAALAIVAAAAVVLRRWR